MALVGLLDCNNFFVSCERLFRPDLWNVPVAVLSSNDGCIVARSQEVKALGIPMGAPYFQVKDICDKNGVVLFSGNQTLYRDISARVMETLVAEVGACEIYSVDEAFFTLPDATTPADAITIRDAIRQKVGVPVTVGVAPTKTLAKVASEIGKKADSYCVLTMDEWQNVAADTTIGSIWGLGRATTAKLGEMGIKNARDLLDMRRSSLRQEFGVVIERTYDELHGNVARAVGENSEALRQSIASTRSFSGETKEREALESAVAGHVVHVAEKLRQRKLCAGRLYVQLRTNRFGDFFMQSGSREIVLTNPTNETKVLLHEAMKAVRELYRPGVPYKKTGVVTASLLPESCITESLFEEVDTDAGVLDSTIDRINSRFGRGMIRPGVLLQKGVSVSAKLRSPHYTTVWKDIPTVTAK